MFVGVDGEAVDNRTRGRYSILAWASDTGERRSICAPAGGELSTVQCLDFVAKIPKAHVWGYSFFYDVNMMLRDLPKHKLQRLYDTNRVWWPAGWNTDYFVIGYVPHKQLTVSRYRDGKRLYGTTVWDMYGWQQCSFADWLEDWQLCAPEEIARIREMKADRADFADDEQRAQLDYCFSECRYLAAGIRRLHERCRDAGIALSKWYSPASLAKALADRHDVLACKADPPPELAAAIEAAYYGGRAEVAQVGPVANAGVWCYDIRSAHPSHTIDLPCLAHATWEQVSTRAKVEPWSLVRVRWDAPGLRWGPLPVRMRSGTCCWPSDGETWAWGVEVIAARRLCPIRVLEHHRLRPGCDHRPFAYLAELYARRAAMKAAGDPAEIVLKLALNATYGMLAQRPTRTNPEAPKYLSFVWAGMITAGTRAQILDALTDDVVSIATDCVTSTVPLPLDVGDELGRWELTTHDQLWIAQPGIYFLHDYVKGRPPVPVKPKTRGFSPRHLKQFDFLVAWATAGRDGTFDLTRPWFIGLGIAFHRINGFEPPAARLWRTWIDQTMTVGMSLLPRRQWLTADPEDGRSRPPTSAEIAAAEIRQSEQYAQRRAYLAELVGRDDLSDDETEWVAQWISLFQDDDVPDTV